MTATATPAPPATASASAPIANSNWRDRKTYVFLATGVLLAILVYAITVDRGADVVAWLLGVLFVLFLVAPSAEQAVKMLATVAALRAGVAFTSTAESDTAAGTAKSEETATPHPVPPAPPPPPCPPGFGD